MTLKLLRWFDICFYENGWTSLLNLVFYKLNCQMCRLAIFAQWFRALFQLPHLSSMTLKELLILLDLSYLKRKKSGHHWMFELQKVTNLPPDGKYWMSLGTAWIHHVTPRTLKDLLTWKSGSLELVFDLSQCESLYHPRRLSLIEKKLPKNLN